MALAAGANGVAKGAPVGFRAIRLRFDIDTQEPQERIDLLTKLTERYCVVFQTLKVAPPLTLTVARQP
ncbi:MAG TPA: OsmC family protein [Stellaceae bacterium]|nr:OsmC family protein [Stellaceae bacterium]